jgi:hypothetical protein
MPSASSIAAMCRRPSMRSVSTAQHLSLSPSSVVSASGKGFAIANQHQAAAGAHPLLPHASLLHKAPLYKVAFAGGSTPGRRAVRLRALVSVGGLQAAHQVFAPAHPCALRLRGLSKARVAGPISSIPPHFSNFCYLNRSKELNVDVAGAENSLKIFSFTRVTNWCPVHLAMACRPCKPPQTTSTSGSPADPSLRYP